MSNIWLVGAGPMARDYMKVLESLGNDYVTIGRGAQSAEDCKEHTSKPVIVGGLTNYVAQQPVVPSHAIIAVPVQELFECTKTLLNYGVKNILVEKPAGLDKSEVCELDRLCTQAQANLLLAYNRRFYSSVEMAQKMIEEDGGCTSCVFEFTEWSHVIEKLNKPKAVFEHWFLGNSTHVVDLAFHLIGKPARMSSFVQGQTSWHSRGSAFSGAGISEKGVLFSYHANWQAPGRWAVELMTPKRRLILKPMEELRVIQLGTVKEDVVSCDEQLIDKNYKPGLYKETQSFLQGDFTKHCSIHDQAELMSAYYDIAGYA